MFKREMEIELKKLTKDYPIVTVIGPRQSGKTTIVKHAFPDKKYANLEFPDVRTMAIEDPRGFLEQFSDGAILDEIQRVPELLSYIHLLLMKRIKKVCLFLLVVINSSFKKQFHNL